MGGKKKTVSSVTPEQAWHQRIVASRLCKHCGANEAKYQLSNGAEILRLCRPCFEEALADLVISNNMICFTTTKRNEPEAMQAYVEVV